MQHLLCYGDSNTWGFIPGIGERFPKNTRWTGILQDYVGEKVEVIEEGLCGRTTVFDDRTRNDRNGFKSLPSVLRGKDDLNAAILMLGTNDCKTYFGNTAQRIAKGLEKCIDVLLEKIPAEKILVLSPIHLGKEVWREENDPEFDTKSIEVSKNLKTEYRKIAEKKGVHFLAASDYATASENDYEHLSSEGHAELADAIYREILIDGILE